MDWMTKRWAGEEEGNQPLESSALTPSLAVAVYNVCTRSCLLYFCLKELGMSPACKVSLAA